VPRHGRADACCRSISPVSIDGVGSVERRRALCRSRQCHSRMHSASARSRRERPHGALKFQTETLPRALALVSVGIDAHGHTGKVIQVNHQPMRYKHEDRGVEERPQAGVSAAKRCKRGDSALIIAMGATSGIVCLTRPDSYHASRRYRCKQRCFKKKVATNMNCSKFLSHERSRARGVARSVACSLDQNHSIRIVRSRHYAQCVLSDLTSLPSQRDAGR
jgi:hypothetical protein